MSSATASTKGKERPKVTLESLQKQLRELRERVEDLEDLRELNQAIDRNQGKRLIPWDEAKGELGLEG